MKYVDGYVIPIPKKNLKAYIRMARIGEKMWMKHGALDYKECVGDDLKMKWGTPLTQVLKLKPGETVIFSYIVFKSRAHRDRVNAKVMKEMDGMTELKDMPLIQLADGWEACATKDIMCFGNYGDQNPLAPNNVPNSTLALWDPSIRWIIDEWWAFKTEGKPFNGNLELRWFTMAEGGSDIGQWYTLDGKIPQDAIDKVEAKRQEILNGTFEVPLNIVTPKSDIQ